MNPIPIQRVPYETLLEPGKCYRFGSGGDGMIYEVLAWHGRGVTGIQRYTIQAEGFKPLGYSRLRHDVWRPTPSQ